MKTPQIPSDQELVPALEAIPKSSPIQMWMIFKKLTVVEIVWQKCDIVVHDVISDDQGTALGKFA
jgi:hypothetical protein